MSVKCLHSLGIGSSQFILVDFFQQRTWFVYMFLSWNYSDFTLTYLHKAAPAF